MTTIILSIERGHYFIDEARASLVYRKSTENLMKKQLIIVGAGTAGTMMANKLHHELDPVMWDVTILDRDLRSRQSSNFLLVKHMCKFHMVFFELSQIAMRTFSYHKKLIGIFQ